MYSAYSKTKTWKVKPYYSIKKKKDIIVMDFTSQVLNEVFAGIFLECSHRFRKGRGAHTFFAHVQN